MAQGQVSIRTLASHHSIVRMPRAGLTFLAWHLVGHLYTFLSISLFRAEVINPNPMELVYLEGGYCPFAGGAPVIMLGGAWNLAYTDVYSSTIWADCGMTVKFLCNMILLTWKQPEPKDS